QSLKGRVVFDGERPEPRIIDVTGQPCPVKGNKVVLDDLVVDAKTKGVRWCVVYLIDANGDFKTPLPINPAALSVLQKKVEIDQPCCKCEPYVVALHKSQTLVAKNSSTVAHNVMINGPVGSPQLNPCLKAGESIDVTGWKAVPTPIPIK